MPTYEYECEACGHHFDEFQSMTEPSLTKCPKCGKKKLTRLFGIGAAVLFKGSGFYETDYRSESYKKAAKADQEAAKPAETNGKSDAAGKNGATDSASTTSGDKGKKSGAKKPKSGD